MHDSRNHNLDDYIYNDLSERYILEHRAPGLFIVQSWETRMAEWMERRDTSLGETAGDIRGYIHDVFGFEFRVECEHWKGVPTVVIYCPWHGLPAAVEVKSGPTLLEIAARVGAA